MWNGIYVIYRFYVKQFLLVPSTHRLFATMVDKTVAVAATNLSCLSRSGYRLPLKSTTKNISDQHSPALPPFSPIASPNPCTSSNVRVLSLPSYICAIVQYFSSWTTFKAYFWLCNAVGVVE